MRTVGVLALAGLVALLAAPAAAQEAPPAQDEVEQLLGRYRDGDDAARTAALARLAELASRRPEAVERWLRHPDPDVRFQVLYLLSARDSRTEQRVRQIVEGSETLAATFPQALVARAAILEQAAREALEAGSPIRTLDLLALIARRRATGDDVGARYAIVALDLVSDIVGKHCASGRAAAEAAAVLAALVETDLGEAQHELMACFAALPDDVALGALRAAIEAGTPAARVRAARVLAEVAALGQADLAAATLQPLLGDRAPEVRLAGLQALSLLTVPPAALVPAAALSTDADPRVAEEALRIAGERGLAFAREAAERLAAEGKTPLALRRRAVITLGLLGHAGSGPTLRGIIDAPRVDRDLRLLAAWALGAVRAEGAVDVLLRLIATLEERAYDDRLFSGLARAGRPGVEALTAMLDPKAAASARGRRLFAIRALGRTAPDGDGGAPRAAVEALVRLSKQPIAQRLGDLGGAAVTENELETAGRSLGDLAPVCDEARTALARLIVERADMTVLDGLLPVVAEVGPPLDPQLAKALEGTLVRLIAQLGGALRPLAASALLRVSPEQAKDLLGRMVGGGRGAVGEESVELMHVLARAGDPTAVRQFALPLARARLEEEQGDERFDLQNRLGIELLYAHQLDEAILEFRRMTWCRPTDAIPSYNVACGHSLAGRLDDALRALRRSIGNGYGDPQHMAADADLDPLRGDPRFQRLMARMRLDEETRSGR